MTDRRTVVVILIAAAILRLVIATRIPLVDDEAYYWVWSQRLAWAYPDHPPMIAAVVRLTTAILGDTPLGVRAGPIVLNLGIAVLLYDLGRRMFGAAAGSLGALWFQTIPLFTVGGILNFPDAPLIFFWMLALWTLWRLVERPRWLWWLVLGAAVGLAALSKLAALFLGMGIAGFVLWGEQRQRWWRRREPYAAAGLAAALIFPLLRWNADHGGLLLAKARDPYAWVHTGVPALNALAFAGAHLVYYGPITAGLLLLSLFAAWRGPRAIDRRYVFTLWTAIPILGFFTALSFDGVAKPHWTAPAFLVALLPATALWMTRRHERPWRGVVAAGVALNLLIVGALTALALWPDSPAGRELRAWPDFVAEVEAVVKETPSGPGRFILVPDYQTAAQIEYRLRDTPVTTPFGFDAYEVWVPRQRLIDRNAIYVTARAPFPGLPLRRMCRRVETLPSISLAAEGQTFRTYAVYRCLGYRGVPRPAASPL